MEIFINKLPRDRFSWFRKIKSMLMPRLYGVNVVSKDPDTLVEPIYTPFISWEVQGNQLWINLTFWRGVSAIVILYNTPPFIWIGRSTGIVLEEVE